MAINGHTDHVGQSGAAIYRLYDKVDAPELYLKQGNGSVANDITDEMVRLYLVERLHTAAKR